MGSLADSRVVEQVSRLAARPCLSCHKPLCGHDAVVSIAMGFADAARCVRCLAGALSSGYEGFRDAVFEHIRRRDCYLAGWQWADGQEGVTPGVRPACLWGEPRGASGAATEDRVSNGNFDGGAPDARWDAGNMSCGDLVLKLRLKLRAMPVGQLLEVRATDPGAREDVPAWCGLTGHTLVSAEHPTYLIRRRPE